jgi:hypothetical protein
VKVRKGREKVINPYIMFCAALLDIGLGVKFFNWSELLFIGWTEPYKRSGSDHETTQ